MVEGGGFGLSSSVCGNLGMVLTGQAFDRPDRSFVEIPHAIGPADKASFEEHAPYRPLAAAASDQHPQPEAGIDLGLSGALLGVELLNLKDQGREPAGVPLMELAEPCDPIRLETLIRCELGRGAPLALSKSHIRR